MKQLAERLGVSKVDINLRTIPRVDGDTSPMKLALSPEEAEQVRSELFPHEQSSGEGKRPDPGQRLCSAGHSLLYVDPYGDVSPCVAFPMVCGNIQDRSIDDIWYNSKELSVFRSKRIGDLDKISTGKLYETHCPGRAFSRCGDYLAPEEWGCDL